MGSDQHALTAEQLEQIRKELLWALARLEHSMEISDEAARPVELDQTAVGRLSRIDSLQNQSLAQGLQDREKVRLSAILEALRRIEEGSFGNCAGCDQPIQFERLLIFPEAQVCAACRTA